MKTLGVGELWSYEDRTVIVCGNGIHDDGRIWCMDWSTGERTNALVAALVERVERHTLSRAVIESRFHSWAAEGNTDAAWWLAWWFEGKFPARSAWYFIAALRGDRQRYQDLAGVQLSNALFGAAETYPPPLWDTRFLRDIPEFSDQYHESRDWKTAIQQAEVAINLLAGRDQLADAIGCLNARPRSAFARRYFLGSRQFRGGLHEPSLSAVAYASGLTVLGLQTHQRYKRWRQSADVRLAASTAAHGDGFASEPGTECPYPARSRLASSWRQGFLLRRDHELTQEGYDAPPGARCPYRANSSKARCWNHGQQAAAADAQENHRLAVDP